MYKQNASRKEELYDRPCDLFQLQSDARDSSRTFWTDGDVHQNITFPAHPEDSYGDIQVGTNKAFEESRKWLAGTAVL